MINKLLAHSLQNHIYHFIYAPATAQKGFAPVVDVLNFFTWNLGHSWIARKGGLRVEQIARKVDCTHECHLFISMKHWVVS